MYKALSVWCQRCTKKKKNKNKITLRCIVIGTCAVQFLHYIPLYRNTQHYASVSRFDTQTLRTQRQEQYVRENGCACSVVWRLLVKERKPEKTRRTTANSRHTTLRAQPFSRTYCCWCCVCNIRVSNLDTLHYATLNCST